MTREGLHHLPDRERTKRLPTDELREHFLIQDFFVPGRLVLRHVDLDRVVLGSAVPLADPIALEAPATLATEFFAERRELGVLNIGGPGVVSVDGQRHSLASRDALYVGRGSRGVVFESDDPTHEARFYIISYPAHATHPTTRIPSSVASVSELGTAVQANRRTLAKYIHPGQLPTAQLVMGVTTLSPGSVWNTMPSHTHARRTEVYLYFGLPDDAVVIHLMGEPDETRHLVVRNEEVVLSPHWSIHSGCGTSSYAFCWAMGGENQDFTDMQAVDMRELK